jgi:hypothetical protein
MASSGQANGDDFPLLLAVWPIEGSADFERIGLANANMITGPIYTSGMKSNELGLHYASWQARWKSRYLRTFCPCASASAKTISNQINNDSRTSVAWKARKLL